MTRTLTFMRPLLAASLLAGAALAQAADGYTVAPRQESLITAGMDASAVEQALGHGKVASVGERIDENGRACGGRF